MTQHADAGARPVNAGAIDRVAPARRPEGRPVGDQRWRDLLFLHWEVPVEVVRPLVPAELELDHWDGRLYVGLVPFAMYDVRPRWLPKAFAFDFLETNLRTYVHDGATPGVWFFSLEAASWLAVKEARRSFGLPYWHARMSRERRGDVFDYRTARRSNAEARLEVSWEVGEALGTAEVGTLDHFLIERYVLFARHRGRLVRGQVHHPAYPLRRAGVRELEQGLLEAAGLPAVAGDPIVHASDGVDVDIYALEHG